MGVDSRAVHVLRRRVVGRGEHGIVEWFGRDPDPHILDVSLSGTRGGSAGMRVDGFSSGE